MTVFPDSTSHELPGQASSVVPEVRTGRIDRSTSPGGGPSRQLDPKDALNYNSRGIAWFSKKEYAKAIADYNEAIRIDPLYSTAYNNRGIVRFDMREYDESVTDFNKAILIDPEYAEPYYNRGIISNTRKNYEKAIADYSAVIRLNPYYINALCNRGFAWQRKKEYEKALADFERASRVDPGHAGALNSRALLLATCPNARFRDGGKAVVSATRACELSEWTDPGYIDTLAAACAEANDFTAAVKWQLRAIELWTDEAVKEDCRSRLKLFQAKTPYHRSEN